MPETTLALVKLFSPVITLAGLGMLLNKKFCEKMIDDCDKNVAITQLFGVISTVAGTAIVLHHNIWEGGPAPIIITLIGWGALAKGALAFLAPEALIGLAGKCKSSFSIAGVITTAIGGYLSYLGYLV